MQRRKTTNSTSNAQSGQAIVEYILLLIVSVSLIVGLGVQLFKPMQAFLKSYMGDYVSCLMETGELPSFGDADAKANLQDQGCNIDFAPATLAQGRPPVSSKSSSSSSSSEKDSSKSSSDSNSGKDSKKESSSSSSSSSASNSSGLNNGPKGGIENSSADNKVTEIPMTPEQSAFMNRQGSWGSQSIGGGVKKSAVGLAGLSEDEQRKLARKENSSRTVASGDEVAQRLKKVAIQKPLPKVVEAEDEPLTFGSFLKFLLIAAIVIAMIVVFGSQALKIANSDE